ncbi:hypothetical protein ISF_00337 [Cordyceps fumosorosea ARSEF 2679]|uniref:Mucin-7 n=1 Tax=Cordyceps fumosorosea (strain ARSEF 2679) TaxID=1081104 RepID=A0A168E6K2_CORFA|nr:hypothetical protein ISF_00337 [Cordyceps fumosorosea ARSEF 2679]OAA73436.1 hypothetical protein ISF_00337 [Cordyceps fumosorosea ARSEF 2679]
MSTHDDTVRNPAAESIPEAPDAAEAAAEQPGPTTTGNAPAKPEEATPVKPAASRSTAVASKTTTKPAASKPEPTKPRTTTKPVATTRATGGVTAAKKPAPVKIGANDTGFVKPKPKSPTKPVNLPSSLMAPTAASAHKGGASRQSNLPQSASAHAVGASAASKPVKRQNSAATRQRPSLGVPSVSKLSQESTSHKRQSHVDEGFLARMMRPTAASSSKTTEKGTPTTPPKKSAPRLSNVGGENVKRPAKSPVPNRAASVARSREVTSRAEKVPAKPATAKTASSIVKAAAVPAAAATTAVAGAAAVAGKVITDSTASKLADKLQDVGIEEPKEEPKQEMSNAPEADHLPVAEHDLEAEQQPKPEPELEAEPEPEELAEDVPVEDVEPEAEFEKQPEPEHETLEEPAEEPVEESIVEESIVEESIEEPAQELETVEDTQREVEEEHETRPAEHIDEAQPSTQEEEPAAAIVAKEPLKEEQFAHEEPAALEELALEAAQVETAEEVMEIAEGADPEPPASLDNATRPTQPVVEHASTEKGIVHNGHLDKAGVAADAEPTPTLPKLAEHTLEHAEHAEPAADESVCKDANTAA